jgi:hypothetical protein
MGLTFKLDVGLYRLNQQVACQRYRQKSLDAESTETLSEKIDRVFAGRQLALAA